MEVEDVVQLVGW